MFFHRLLILRSFDIALYYHLKMFHSFLDSLFFLFRTSRLSARFRLRFVIIFPFNDPILPLHLRNIQVRHMKPVLLPHPFLDLLISRLAFRCRDIHLIHIDLHTDVILSFRKFGQKAHRLDMPRQKTVATICLPRS